MAGEAVRALGEALRGLQRRSGMTQREMAAACGVGQATVTRMVSLKRLPHRSTLEAVLTGLGASQAEQERLVRMWLRAQEERNAESYRDRIATAPVRGVGGA